MKTFEPTPPHTAEVVRAFLRESKHGRRVLHRVAEESGLSVDEVRDVLAHARKHGLITGPRSEERPTTRRPPAAPKPLPDDLLAAWGRYLAKNPHLYDEAAAQAKETP